MRRMPCGALHPDTIAHFRAREENPFSADAAACHARLRAPAGRRHGRPSARRVANGSARGTRPASGRCRFGAEGCSFFILCKPAFDNSNGLIHVLFGNPKKTQLQLFHADVGFFLRVPQSPQLGQGRRPGLSLAARQACLIRLLLFHRSSSNRAPRSPPVPYDYPKG